MGLDTEVLASQISRRLRAARKAAGFKTAIDFTKTYHIPISTYSQHESGKRALNAEMLIAYGERFNVRPGWLLTGEGQPYDARTTQTEARLATLEHELLDIHPVSSKVQADLLKIHDAKTATIDMELFNAVLLRFLPVWNEVNISHEELLEFVFEVYNGIVTTSASLEDKCAMIDLSVASLKRGATRQEKKHKTA